MAPRNTPRAAAPAQSQVFAEIEAGQPRLLLSEVADSHPLLRGKAVSTIWRWARHGVRGVRLEICRIGSEWATTKTAVDRFVRRLNGQEVASAR